MSLGLRLVLNLDLPSSIIDLASLDSFYYATSLGFFLRGSWDGRGFNNIFPDLNIGVDLVLEGVRPSCECFGFKITDETLLSY